MQAGAAADQLVGAKAAQLVAEHCRGGDDQVLEVVDRLRTPLDRSGRRDQQHPDRLALAAPSGLREVLGPRPRQEVSARLGPSSRTLDQDHYIQVTDAMDRRAARTMAEILEAS